MSERPLRVAFIKGPMYDAVYKRLPDFEQLTGLRVKVAFHGSHPELNAHLASLSNVPYDLVSTHTKYAPSQFSFLAALDDIADELEIQDFYPRLIDLARVEGRLFGVPRNIDTKLLHYRTDLISRLPQTWDELVETVCHRSSDRRSYGFVFPGIESGLFGMFYELAEMAHVSLFPPSNVPLLNNEGGRWVLGLIRRLYDSGAVPAGIIDWQYEEAHRCFLKGEAAMICDWPGYFSEYCDPAISNVSDRFALARMPSGPNGEHKAYSGCHTFALTHGGLERKAAVELLRFLNAPGQQLLAAQHGSVPSRPAVLAEIRSQAKPFEAERWRLLDLVIGSDMLIPPPLSYYPEIEETIWRTVRAAMSGEITIQAALVTMERRMAEFHRKHAEQS